MISEKLKSISLTDCQVKERIEQGKVNFNAKSKSKSIKRILFDNIVTVFNFLNIFLALMLFLVGSYKNMLFMGVVLCNTFIGIVQEIRSKKSVDKLSIVVSNNVEVVRNNNIKEISIYDIVIDDLIILKAGQQIPTDCVVVEGSCSVNESLLTGESDLVEKRENSTLLSGSFITSGMVFAKVIHIGNDNFSTKIQNGATYHKKINSEIMSTLNKILTFCSISIFPVGIALFVNQYFIHHSTIQEAVVSVVAALIGMIPEGLVLLTSTVLAVSVIRLARKKVLVQQLFCIETLARVDVLCLDKTGTITTGDMEVIDIQPIDCDEDYVKKALCSLANSTVDSNPTITAIGNAVSGSGFNATKVIPFSSEKKWSGGSFDNGKSYVLGAAEFIFDKTKEKQLFEKISKIDDIIRVITLSESDNGFENNELPKNLKPIALILIKDKIRENASETINYFNEQGVSLKVISGDNNKTVEMIAKSVGILNAEKSVDATTLDTDEKLADAAVKYTVFGRVTPEQKKKLVVALKKNGHTVAMTGDGVNDVLALKEADCSVSVASGSDAAKNIAQLVLVDDNFASMPKVVAEGRRSINNIQRSASLFLVKTIFSVILAIAFIFIGSKYPFEPIQMSLISAMTIGLPSFVLALQPNNNIIKGHFFKNVVLNALPAGLLIATNIIFISLQPFVTDYSQISTIAVVLNSLVGVMMVIRLSIPFNGIRVALLTVIISGLILGITVFGWFFSIVPLSLNGYIILGIMSGISILLFNLFYNFNQRFLDKE